MKFNKLIPELVVSNLEKSKEFYTNIGFEVMYEREGFVFLELETSQIMLCQSKENDNWIPAKLEFPYGRGINISIEVSDVDSLYNKIKSNAYKIFIEMADNYYRKDDVMLGNREFLIMDPDGYVLRFNQDIGEVEC